MPAILGAITYRIESTTILTLAVVTYVIPFLFILYPALLDPGTHISEVAEAFLSGSIFVVGFAALFGGLRVTGNRLIDKTVWLFVAMAAVYPHWLGVVFSGALSIALWALRRRRGFTFIRPQQAHEAI